MCLVVSAQSKSLNVAILVCLSRFSDCHKAERKGRCQSAPPFLSFGVSPYSFEAGLTLNWVVVASGRTSSACRTGVREAPGLECTRLPDWSVRGSRTGVREAPGLECARLLDWSVRGSRTGVREALGLECGFKVHRFPRWQGWVCRTSPCHQSGYSQMAARTVAARTVENCHKKWYHVRKTFIPNGEMAQM